jgi:hypothetical protein
VQPFVASAIEVALDKSVTVVFQGNGFSGWLRTNPITSWPAASKIFAILPPTNPLDPVTAILAIVFNPIPLVFSRAPLLGLDRSKTIAAFSN